jgi:Zn-finger nucleic acid-binding protein
LRDLWRSVHERLDEYAALRPTPTAVVVLTLVPSAKGTVARNHHPPGYVGRGVAPDTRGETMHCPIDETTLVMSERNGIEIDYCPQCRGVWLDRGELDKIIDRSASMPQPTQAPAPAPGYDRYDDRDDRRQQHYAPQQGHYKKRKKESWLSEIFD